MAEKADDKKADSKKGSDGQKSPRIVSIEDKKARQKEVIQKMSSEQSLSQSPENSPLNAHGQARISFNFTFELDKSAKLKLPFLAASLLFLLLSFVMLEKVGFSFSDIFDFERISNNFEKLFSISFVLFILLYSLALGLATFFGFNMRSSNAFVFSMSVILPLVISFFLDPTHRYFLANIWLAFGVVLGVLFATLLDNLSFGSIYRTLGHALFVMLIVAVLFTAVKVNSQKEEYFNLFVQNIAELTPQLQGQVSGPLGDVIESIELSEAELTELVGESDTSYMSDSSIRALVLAQYPSFREVVTDSFKKPEDRKFAKDNTIAAYTGLGAADQNKLIEETRIALQDPEARKISDTAVVKIWPKLRSALADSVRKAQ